jgi:Cu/Ag efflux protein CusF
MLKQTALTALLCGALWSAGCATNPSSPPAPVPSSEAGSASPTASTAPIEAHGTIKEVSKEKNEVVIQHGDIPEIKMKAMTMPYPVKSPDVLNGVKAGDKVDFFIDHSGGGIVIVRIVPAK